MNQSILLQQLALNNSTNTSLTGLEFAKDYVSVLPSLILRGDIAAIILTLIVAFIILIIINKISSMLLTIIRRTIIFAITFIVMFAYVPVFYDKVVLEGITLENVLIGFIGGLLCLFALMLAINALFKDTQQIIKARKIPDRREEVDAGYIVEHEKDQKLPELSFSGITKDKSLQQLLIYTVVAQFGVFSSVTLAAPNIKVGLTMLLIFFIAAFVFIKQSYGEYKVGLVHLAIAFGVGVMLSLLLGVFWSDNNLTSLLSLEYFKSDSLVALITGMAVSMFAGSKH